jgi:hypothetical protein
LQREVDHVLAALAGKLASEIAADIDRAQRRAGNVAEDCGRARAVRFLEYLLVRAQAETLATPDPPALTTSSQRPGGTLDRRTRPFSPVA